MVQGDLTYPRPFSAELHRYSFSFIPRFKPKIRLCPRPLKPETRYHCTLHLSKSEDDNRYKTVPAEATTDVKPPPDLKDMASDFVSA